LIRKQLQLLTELNVFINLVQYINLFGPSCSNGNNNNLWINYKHS
jgi:hypothetical protein